MAKERVGFVDDRFDPSLKEFQNCTPSAGNDVEVIYSIGFSKEVVVDGELFDNPSCPTDILWINDVEDFSVTEMPTGEISFNRDTIENDAEREQTASGQTTQTKAFKIKGDHNSRLFEMFRNIQVSDQMGGYGTKLMKAYSNGGLHLKTEIQYKTKNYSYTEYCLNVKTDTWPDTSHRMDADTEYEFEFLVEYDQLFQYDGEWLDGLGIPEGNLAMVTTETLDGLELTINAEVTDNTAQQSISSNEHQVYVSVINTAEGVGEIGAFKLESGKDETLTLDAKTGDVIKLVYNYMLGANVLSFAKTSEITVTDGGIIPIEIAIENTTVNATVGDAKPTTDEDYISAFGVTTTGGLAPVTITVDKSAVDLGSEGTYDVIFAASDAQPTNATKTGQLVVAPAARKARAKK